MHRSIRNCDARYKLALDCTQYVGLEAVDDLALGLVPMSSLRVGYLMAIKGSQPDLHAEITRQLSGRSAKSADAELEERYRGNTVTWRVWRTQDMAGWGNWTHIRQGIRIERTTVPDDPSKDTTVEQRYYVSNVPWNRLDHEQWIWAIRCHWRVENNAHWVLDMIFKEDKRPWTRNPHGMLAMIMLRRIAFNLVSLFRGVYLRSDENRATPWKDVIEPFYDTMRAAKLEHLLRSRDLARRNAQAA